MKHSYVADVLVSENIHQEYTVKGWVRAFRGNQFLSLNDGSTIKNLQCVVDFGSLTLPKKARNSLTI